jgi:hypothetical protein
MKVLQSLGQHGGTQQVAIFQYRRTPQGIEIQSVPDGESFSISTEEWQSMLEKLGQSSRATFPLSGENSLHGRILEALPGKGFTPSHAAKIAAILEHEGSIDHYGGVTGQGQSVSIYLRRDY